MNAEKKIRGGEVLTALYLSIPEFSQTGTKTIAPPSPKAPPISPAAKPEIMEDHIFLLFILSDSL
jgi:hypothetical protein